MSTLKSSAEDLTLNADGSGNDIKFQSNGVEKGSLTAEGVLTATSFAGSGANLTGISGRKNILYNGAMKIPQRGTSWAAIASGSYSLDRWQFNNLTIGAYTVTQDSNAPDGFANSFKIDCTTADASPAAADYLLMMQKNEGQDLQQLKKGTNSAESVTLSFWVKCNKTGDFQVNLLDNDNSRIIGNAVTINSADTWEQKTITFAGDTTGAFDDDTNRSLDIEWMFDAGSTYTSGSVPTSWQTTTQADRGAGVTLALADSTSNYINITGVQLELGTVATDFEHKSYGEELALCQRYYYQYMPTFDASPLAQAHLDSATQAVSVFYYPTTMRAAPTITFSQLSDWKIRARLAYYATSSIGGFDITESQTGFYFNTASSLNQGDGVQLRTVDSASNTAKVTFDAEL